MTFGPFPDTLTDRIVCCLNVSSAADSETIESRINPVNKQRTGSENFPGGDFRVRHGERVQVGINLRVDVESPLGHAVHRSLNKHQPPEWRVRDSVVPPELNVLACHPSTQVGVGVDTFCNIDFPTRFRLRNFPAE